MSNFMNKNMFIVSLFFSCGLVKAMKEKDISIQEDLPVEMNLYMTQFLGSNLAETLKNIVTLSQVNNYFHSLITHNPKMIGRILRDKFGDERLRILDNAATINELDNDAAISNKFQVIKNFLQKGIVDISEVLDAAIKASNFGLINFLYTINILKDTPSLKIGDKVAVPDGRLVTPLNYVWIKLLNKQETWPIIIEMIENGANVNQIMVMIDEEDTPLGFAFSLGNKDFFEKLLSLGADPTIKNKYGRSVLNSFEGAPGFMRPFIDALEKRGFKVSMRINNKRGRMFTVQRKKIQHRNRSIARNARKYNYQSI